MSEPAGAGDASPASLPAGGAVTAGAGGRRPAACPAAAQPRPETAPSATGGGDPTATGPGAAGGA
eukprot:13840924-Alexandrium_andersonii.AAC.1